MKAKEFKNYKALCKSHHSIFIYFFQILGYLNTFFFLFLALGLCCGAWAFSSRDAWAPEHVGSVAAVCGLSCPVACGKSHKMKETKYCLWQMEVISYGLWAIAKIVLTKQMRIQIVY